MDSSRYDAMTEAQIRGELHALSVEASYFDDWRKLGECESGKFLVGELKRLLETVREGYGRLPTNSDHTAALLAGLQGSEDTYKRIINKMEDVRKSKKTLDSEVQLLYSSLKNKEEAAHKEIKNASIISKNIKE